jgi:WD40 repeat protein
MHLLHWLEVLCLLDKLKDAVLMLSDLEGITVSKSTSSLHGLVQADIRCYKQEMHHDIKLFVCDAKRFVMSNMRLVSEAPLQLYSSALAFAPSESNVRQQFLSKIPPWVVRLPQVEQEWSAISDTVECPGPTDPFCKLAFSPVGDLLAIISERCVQLIDTATGALKVELQLIWFRACSVHFSPDGQLLAISLQRGRFYYVTKLYDLKLGAWRDGYLEPMPYGGYGPYRYYDDVQVMEKPELTFSPDSRLLVISTWLRRDLPKRRTTHRPAPTRRVEVWDVQAGVVNRQFCPRRVIRNVGFSNDGNIAACSSDCGNIFLWDLRSDKFVRQVIQAHSGIFSPSNGTFVYISARGSVVLESPRLAAGQHTLKCGTSDMVGLAFAPNGKLLLSWSHHACHVWDVDARSCRYHLLGTASIGGPKVSRDGQLLLWLSNAHCLNLWHLETGKFFATVDCHDDIKDLAISYNGRWLATLSNKGPVTIWEVEQLSASGDLYNQESRVTAVAFSPDGTLLVIGLQNGALQMLNVADGAAQDLKEANKEVVQRISFAATGVRFAASSETGSIQVWQTDNSELIYSFATGTTATWVALSHDGRLVAHSAPGCKCRLADIDAGTNVSFGGRYSVVADATISPCGKLLAIFDGKCISIWDVRTLRLRSKFGSASWKSSLMNWHYTYYIIHDKMWHQLLQHTALAFSPDSRTIAIAMANPDGSEADVTLWDWATKVKIGRLKLDWAVRRLSFSPDGSQMLTDRGAYPLMAAVADTAADQQALSAPPSSSVPTKLLTVSDAWISLAAQHVLRLPHNLRGALCDVHGATVFLGMRHGKAMLIELDPAAIGGRVSQAVEQGINPYEWTRPGTSKFWRPLRQKIVRALR